MQTRLQTTNQRSVLVVEDDQAISKLIRNNLEDRYTRVFEAATGLECIRILGQDKVDLILLDVGLPDFSGWGILSLLRLTATMRHIPIILVSAEPPDRALVERLQPDDYIQKPFDIRNLLARMKKVIASRDASK